MDYLTNDTDLKKVADAIRAKGNTTDLLAYPDEFVTAIGNIQAGGGSAAEGDITFYDYEGTIVESWTLSELANKTALPAYPSHEGLICQGWNWSLADLKATNRKMNVGAMYITDDGKTRIYIHLEEGRTSPMLGCCPNGTVTVDWGDGTTPDTLTGTSTSTVKWTPTHNYAAPGDYVIKLTVSGTMGFIGIPGTNKLSAILRYSSDADVRNGIYQNSVREVEVGIGVTDIGEYAFETCRNLRSIAISADVTNIAPYAFESCTALGSIVTPIGATSVAADAFSDCFALTSIAIPIGVTSIESVAFAGCYNLTSITIPPNVTNIGGRSFSYCYRLPSITIPDGVTNIGPQAFRNDYTLTSIAIPPGATNFTLAAFAECSGIVLYDFSRHTAVPTLGGTGVFEKIAPDCEIRVPAALVDEWKAAKNWATYADHIVGV